MKKHSFGLLCFCLLCFAVGGVQAQRNYRPGFIITLQKDTICGQIDFRTDKMNEEHCVFKDDSTLQKVVYKPVEIWGYRFIDDGKMYLSKSVTLKAGEPSVDIFLECLVQGVKSLYYMDGGVRPTYFVEDGDRLVKVDAPQLAERNIDFQFRGEKDRYIPILHYVFSDCPTLKSQIDRTHFNHKSLVKLTKKYHYAMCTSNEDCVEFVTKVDEKMFQIRLTPYGGIMQYTLPQGIFAGSFRRPSLSYSVGIHSAFSSRRLMSSISGVVDASFSRLATTDGTFNYSCTLFSPQLGLRYTYPKGRVRPFAGVGADVSMLIASDSDNENMKLQKGIYPGYYAEAGLDVGLSRLRKHALNIRFQFKNIRSIASKCNFANGFSATVGYAFQVR